MLEKQIQDSVLAVFHAEGLYAQRINSGTVQNAMTGSWVKLADRGHSDIVACDKQNRIVFLEIKSPVGKLSPEQILFLRTQHKHGRRWAVIDCYEDAVQFLVDETFHGKQKHLIEVLDESRKYIPPKVSRKSAKMTMGDVLDFTMWADRHGK